MERSEDDVFPRWLWITIISLRIITRAGGRGRAGAGAGKAGFFQKSRPAFRAGSLINIDTIYQAGKADCQKAGKKPAFPAPASTGLIYKYL
jgi:hypothetical protein